MDRLAAMLNVLQDVYYENKKEVLGGGDGDIHAHASLTFIKPQAMF